jgi:hypothetical protein
MPDHPNIIFLHIPKTAGQSVHAFLVQLFNKRAISPSRVNEQLVQMSIPELRKYSVFSGHLDWALLDCLQGPRFAFTILRDPTDRILSFYFFLRKTAAALPPQELELPQNQGMRAALKLPCDEYFASGEPGLRNFLDNHYDNFYAHFFAGRTYDARQRLVGQKRADPSFTDGKIVDLALQNLSVLEGVYPIDRLDLLETDLRSIAGEGAGGKSLVSLRVNQGDGADSSERIEKLRALGATPKTFDRIRRMTVLDQVIWDQVRQKSAVPA